MTSLRGGEVLVKRVLDLRCFPNMDRAGNRLLGHVVLWSAVQLSMFSGHDGSW